MKYFKFLYVKNHLLNSILIIWPLWKFESLVWAAQVWVLEIAAECLAFATSFIKGH